MLVGIGCDIDILFVTQIEEGGGGVPLDAKFLMNGIDLS